MLKPAAKIIINMDGSEVTQVEGGDTIDDPGQPKPDGVSVERVKTASANGCPAYIIINHIPHRI